MFQLSCLWGMAAYCLLNLFGLLVLTAASHASRKGAGIWRLLRE